MRVIAGIISTISAGLVLGCGFLFFPYLFADRITHSVDVAGRPLIGLRYADLAPILIETGEAVASREIPVEFRGIRRSAALEKLGIQVDVPATLRAIQHDSDKLQFLVDQVQAKNEMEKLFQNVIRPPQNASLAINAAGKIQLVKSEPGEAVDSVALTSSLQEYLTSNRGPLPLRIIPASPRVDDTEVNRARVLAEKLFVDGLRLQFEDKEFLISAGQLRRLIEFVEQVDPQQPENYVLGVRLNPKALREQLEKIAQAINQEPVDAKFEINHTPEVRITQFSAPERGLNLNIDASAEKIAQAITVGDTTVPLAVVVTQPAITKHADLEKLGITELIATGESDFAGSPRNRIYNITVGASRYHGLLIAPGEEFSFNEHLGPVTAAAGFKPELVIKKNVTTPEYGGGLCQVSTTAFRAAVQAGLKITARRAHAYAVRYYGTPGFDATIYPNYTDLRFQNNTPGHILVQTKIEGTRLVFSFYGTPDGRSVEIDGPDPYNRRPDGSVKATLTQRVFKDGQTILDETFHSNYRSPALFPRT